MRVLIVSEKWWPEGGGAELATHLIAKGLIKRGIRVAVVHGTKQARNYESGIIMIYTPLLEERIKHKLWINATLLWRSKWFMKLVENVDLIYIPRLAYPLALLTRKRGIPVVIHLHDYQPISYNAITISKDVQNCRSLGNVIYAELLSKGLLKSVLVGYSLPLTRIARLMVSEADRIICVSKAQCKIISNKLPEIRDKSEVIYNPKPSVPKIRKELSRSRAFIYVGGGSLFKGFYILSEFLLKMVKSSRDPHIKIFVTGKINMKERVILERINRISNGKLIKILGYLKWEDLLKYYAESHALLFPSILEEPLPYAVMESMLTGTAPIASRVGGVPEITQGTYAEGLMFSPGNSDQIIDRVESVISLSNDDFLEIGHNLRRAILDRFSENSTIDKLVNLFYDIVADR